MYELVMREAPRDAETHVRLHDHVRHGLVRTACQLVFRPALLGESVSFFGTPTCPECTREVAA